MDTDIVLNYICLILFKKIFSCSKNDMYVYFRTEGIVPYSRWRLYRDAYVWVLIMIITRLQQPMLSIPKKKLCVIRTLESVWFGLNCSNNTFFLLNSWNPIGPAWQHHLNLSPVGWKQNMCAGPRVHRMCYQSWLEPRGHVFSGGEKTAHLWGLWAKNRGKELRNN